MSMRYLSNLFCSLVFLIIALTINAQDYDWTRTNPGAGGAFNVVKVGPTAKVIACSDLSGAYLSNDDGASWTVLGDNVGIDQTHASTVGFHTKDESTFCIGTEDGIYLTTDAGLNFIKTLSEGYIEDITYSRSDSEIAYAAYHPVWNSDSGSIYKSTDGGSSWESISVDLPSKLRILKIEISPLNANVIYCLSGAGDFACTEALLFKSINGGVNWTQVNMSEPIMDFEVSNTNENHLYITTMNANCNAQWYWTDLEGSFYESIDAGESWHELASRTGVIWIEEDTMKLIDPREPYEWISSAGTWSSDDNGINWEQIGEVDDMEVAFPGSLLWSYGTTDSGICRTLGETLTPGVRYWAHSRFVYGTEDGGLSFKNKFSNQNSENTWTSRGIDNVVMYDLEINESNTNIIYAGYWDIGLWRSLDKGKNWEYCSQEEFTGNWEGNGGNVMSILSDPDRTNVVWAASKGSFGEDGYVIKSTDTGRLGSWISSNQGLNQSSDIYSLTYLPDSPINNRELLVSSGGEIYKSTDDGLSWSRKSSDGGIRVFAVDQFDNDIIYAGGEKGFWRSADRGESWTETGISDFTGTTNGSSDEWGWEGVTDICSDPFNPNMVYISVLGAGKGLYKSIDSGLSWEQIFQNRFMRSIELSKNISDKIYAGSSSAYSSGGLRNGSKGILLSEDGGGSWTEINGAMPFPFALTIDISGTEHDTVYVGSPGTGFQYSVDPTVSSTKNADQLSETRFLKVNPNPVKDFLNIEWESQSPRHIEIYDLQGQLLITLEVNNEDGDQNISFPVSELPNGTYFIKVNSDIRSSYKFIKI